MGTTTTFGPARGRAALLITACLLAACGHHGEDGGTATATDGATAAPAVGGTPTAGASVDTASAAVAAALRPDPAAVPAVLSSQIVARRAGVVRERWVYGAGGLRIAAQVCRPDDDARHPLVMYQHAGFSGLQTEGDGIGLCTLLAARGYAVAMSTYRGEDGSDGAIEYCLGEVEDSLALLSLAQATPWTQAGRLALIGVSHGACITLRMLARGVVAQAAVSLAGPTDWAAIWTVATARAALDPADAEAVDFLTRANVLLGPPSVNPAAWAARSPLAQVAALRGTASPLLVLQGADDATVPVDQACALANAMGGFEATHLARDYLPLVRTARTGAPVPGCAAPQPAWAAGDHPRTRNWAGDRHLVVYDGLGHDDGLQVGFAAADLVDFIAAKFPASAP